LEGHSQHFLAALQVIAHALTPLRKALIHFHLTCRNKTLEVPEWMFLQGMGKFFQSLIAKDDTAVDPTDLYQLLEARLLLKNKNDTQNNNDPTKRIMPRNATHAVQLLLETIHECSRTLPVTSNLWSALLDMEGMGLIARQSIVGKQPSQDQKEILQRTKRDSCIMWCPLNLEASSSSASSTTTKAYKSLPEALQGYCQKQTHSYDWDKQPFDF
jgi:hypothetical protein